MKKQIIIGLSLVYCLLLNAQDTTSVIHFDFGRGTHDLTPKAKSYLVQGDGSGYTFNAGYDYYFTPSMSIKTGIGIQTFSGLSTLNLSTATPAIDQLNRSYEFRSVFTNWQEKQNVVFINIPVAYQYRYRLNPYCGLIGSAGLKLSIPIASTYESTGNGSFMTTGYYSQWDTEVSDVPEYGFGTYTTVPKGHSPINVYCSATADLGGFVKVAEKTDLYVGFYLDYGLNSIKKSSTKDLYQTDGVYNGVFSSNISTKIFPTAMGIKVGINLCWAPKKKQKAPVDGDGDGDEVVDSKDKCPNTPNGVEVDENGCPLDADGDGVPDYMDKCPNTSAEAIGKVDENGCPKDTDGDGVPDYLDKCPNTPKEAISNVDANGCPIDSDADGVPDFSDKCPNTPKEAMGKVDEKGCPKDTDGDGVPDYLDNCPNTPKEAGTVDTHGCPIDSDADGVPDYLDKCPNTPKEAMGKVDAHGCPLDSDGDGVLDYLDKCPTVPGIKSNQGCPEIKKEVKSLFEEAKQGIKFELGKQVINSSSFSILDKIAATLLSNPNYAIEVQGHTDSEGKPDVNLTLSINRAKAVKQYLVNAGVEEKRLTSNGYGDKFPVSSNSTAEGRALNRRVEFVISFIPLN